MFQKKERHCNRCGFSTFFNEPNTLECGYICKLNPFKPVIMGIMEGCAERKNNKVEHYSDKDS